MEGEKQSSSSSFTNKLFGSKESLSSSSASSSSSGLFNSIFPPPSKAYGNDYISSEFTQKKNHDYCATKRDTVDKLEDKNRKPNVDMSAAFYDQDTSPPCHLSSSIYYGGQDIYPSPHATKNTPGHYSSTQYNKDGEDDGRASRGNWWQGSLYY